MYRKRQLYEQFRAFALNKLKTHGQEFQIKFRSINGSLSLKYRELGMNEDFFLIYGNFTFDPKTDLISNYVRNEFISKKTEEDFNDLIAKEPGKLRRFLKIQQTLDNARRLERIRINQEMKKKVDKILMGIFKGDLSFSDPEFKELVTMSIILERDLQELNTRIATLDLINSNSGLSANVLDDKPLESKSKV